ncbi:MAG: glycosyltransferase [Bacteroidales bacterium]|nr:glycosyltransferase [Bacteroidales bacterium]
MNQRIFSKYIQRIIDDYEIDIVVGTFVAPPPKARRVIFDLFDDNVSYWRRFGRGRAYANEIEAVEFEYMKTANAIVAASSVLREKAKKIAQGTPVHLIPNGVDISQYRKADGREFRSQFQISGKLIGNVGSHDKRNEMELMLAVAALMRNEPLTFLIAGRGSQLEWTRQEAQRLGLRNIRFHGVIPFEQLPFVMNSLDVGLCPYEKTEGADASSPMRLLSYLAAEVPVVCTDITSVRMLEMDNVVLVSDTPECFVKGIRQALTLPRMRPQKLMEFNLPQMVEKYEKALLGEDLCCS